MFFLYLSIFGWDYSSNNLSYTPMVKFLKNLQGPTHNPEVGIQFMAGRHHGGGFHGHHTGHRGGYRRGWWDGYNVGPSILGDVVLEAQEPIEVPPPVVITEVDTQRVDQARTILEEALNKNTIKGLRAAIAHAIAVLRGW